MNIKKCIKCKQSLNEDLFSWKNKLKGTKQSHCKECKKIYNKNHYINNMFKVKSTTKKNKKIYKEEVTNFLIEYFQNHFCLDCNESDIRVLDFDHLRDKKFSVSTMICRNMKISLIKEEISKCVVRCANCHRRKTLDEIDSWKSKVFWGVAKRQGE